MAKKIKTKYHHQEDDSLYALRVKNETDWLEFGELAQKEFENSWMTYMDGTNGKKAKSPKELIQRGCVYCSGFLHIIEETENGHILLECNSCHRWQWQGDTCPDEPEMIEKWKSEAKTDGVNNFTPRHLPNELYQSIPDDLILTYMRMRERRQQ